MYLTGAEYPKGAVPVDGYGPGFFRIAGERREGGIVLSPAGIANWAGLSDRAPLLKLAGRVDLLFLGMGSDIAIPPRQLVSELEAAGIMVEPMATPSAARGYNVLLAEGRRIACALIPV